MKRLTEKDDWSPDYAESDSEHRIDGIEEFYRTNENIRELWDRVLLPRLRDCGARTAVEIGSAPGQNLIELANGLGITPFGIEYTEEGTELNRRLFARHGIGADHVLCDDFFSPALDSRLGTFDIALSFGFVEHFDDPVPVIRRQLEFCRVGGYVIIIIPDLRGIYYVWNAVFNARVIETHNTTMMRNDSFFKMCEGIASLEVIFKGSIGTFEYGLLTHAGKFIPRAGISLVRRISPAIRAFDRHVLARLGLGQSPYLVVIGKRVG